MNYFWQGVPSKRWSDDRCPLCGSAVLYRGFSDVECAGHEEIGGFDYSTMTALPNIPACKNYKPGSFW